MYRNVVKRRACIHRYCSCWHFPGNVKRTCFAQVLFTLISTPGTVKWAWLVQVPFTMETNPSGKCNVSVFTVAVHAMTNPRKREKIKGIWNRPVVFSCRLFWGNPLETVGVDVDLAGGQPDITRRARFSSGAYSSLTGLRCTSSVFKDVGRIALACLFSWRTSLLWSLKLRSS